MTPYFLLAILASYMTGAIPVGFLAGKTRGIDIRSVGSGNIGATNVFRTLGKGLGIFTFACDVAKGFVSAYLYPLAALHTSMTEQETIWLGLACACAAVAGHNWPVYLNFKGGKGIATTTGALLGVAPAALGVGILSWLIVFPISRYVSLASIIAAISVTVSGWLFYHSKTGVLLPLFLTILGLLAILRHKPNIQRLLKGTENRFKFGKSRKQKTEARNKG